MDTVFVCVCGAESPDRLIVCPRCNRYHSFRKKVYVPNRTVTSDLMVVSGKEVISRARSAKSFGGLWTKMFPGIQEPFMVVLWGSPGVGKSTVGLMLAHDWDGPSMYYACETGVGPSISGLMVTHEVYNMDMSCPVCWDQMRESAAGYSLVVIDSFQSLRLDPNTVRSEFPGRGINTVIISQTSQDGSVRGGMAVLHDADVNVSLPEYGKFSVQKNRYGDLVSGEWNE